MGRSKKRLLIACFSCVFSVPSPSAWSSSPKDDAETIAAIRKSLESYYKAIKSVRVRYVQTWEPSESSPLVNRSRERAEAGLREQLKSSDAAGRKLAEKMLKSRKAPKESTITLMDAFPSLRQDIETTTHLEGHDEVELFTRIYHNKVYRFADHSDKEWHSGKEFDMNTFSPNPLEAIGLRIRGSLNLPLVALLDKPSLVHIEGHDSLDGHKVVVLRIGPDVPEYMGQVGVNPDNFVRLWLAEELDFFPVKTGYEFYLGGKADHTSAYFHRFSARGLRPVRVDGKGREMILPSNIEYSDLGGTYHWRILDIAINPTFQAHEFDPPVPDGYLEYRDGKTPTVTISGGAPARNKIASETVDAARDMLAHSPPPDAGTSWWQLVVRVGVPVSLVVVIVVLLTLRRRF